jgi:multicomponent K+:H+ antiporter subunit D
MPWVWATVLGGTFFAILGMVRAGSQLFWKPADSEAEVEPSAPRPLHRFASAPAWVLLAMLAGWTVFAGPATSYAEATTQQVFERKAYIEAVLGPQESGS